MPCSQCACPYPGEPHHARPVQEWAHTLNVPLVRCLWSLHANGGPARLVNLPLNHSEIDNFQKLRYWDLVERVRPRGFWKITDLGKMWLLGGVKVYNRVRTVEGNVVGYDLPMMRITDVKNVHYNYAPGRPRP